MNKPTRPKAPISDGRMIRQQETAERKKMSRDELDRHIARLRERDKELVTGIFKNLEMPNSGATVSFGVKLYPGDQYTFYELVDGERYQLPRGVVRHLNTGCYIKEYKHLPGEFGTLGMRAAVNDGRLKTPHTMTAEKKLHRFAFQPLDFMEDDGDLRPADLVEVSYNP
jgi:hypothetical protein